MAQSPMKVRKPFIIKISIPILYPEKRFTDQVFKLSAKFPPKAIFPINHSALLIKSRPSIKSGAARQTARTFLSFIALFVRIPNANKPNKGPYVYPATFRMTSMMDLLSIHLKTITHNRKTNAKERCTPKRFLLFSFSVLISSFFHAQNVYAKRRSKCSKCSICAREERRNKANDKYDANDGRKMTTQCNSRKKIVSF